MSEAAITFRSAVEIPKIACSALKMAAFDYKASTAVTWSAKDLMWMSFEISFSIRS